MRPPGLNAFIPYWLLGLAWALACWGLGQLLSL